MEYQKIRWLTCLLLIWLPLFGCSEGDGPIGTGFDEIQISGTAATGAPITNTTVTAKDRSGNKTSVETDSVGSFQINVDGANAPYLIKTVTNDGTIYYSVATKSGITNINPLTDIVVRNWFLVRNRDIDTEFDNSQSIFDPPLANQINAIVEAIINLYKLTYDSFSIDNNFNFLQTAFTANQSGFDHLLDFNQVQLTTDLLTINVINPDNINISASILFKYDLRTDLSRTDNLPPSAPQNVSVISANSSMPNNSSMVVVWNASSDNIGVSGYHIYRSIGPDSTPELIGSSPYPIYSDTGLPDNTEYCYKVAAVDGASNESGFSDQGCNITTPVTATINPVTLSLNQIETITLAPLEEGFYQFLPNISGGIKIDTTASSTLNKLIQIFDNAEFVDPLITNNCVYNCTTTVNNITAGFPLYLYIKNLGVEGPVNILIQKSLNDGSTGDPKPLIVEQITNVSMEKSSSSFYSFTTVDPGFYQLVISDQVNEYGFPYSNLDFTVHTFENSQKTFITADKLVGNSPLYYSITPFYYSLRANQTYFVDFQNPRNEEVHFTIVARKGNNSGTPLQPQTLAIGAPYADTIDPDAESFFEFATNEAGAYRIHIDPPESLSSFVLNNGVDVGVQYCSKSADCLLYGLNHNTKYKFNISENSYPIPAMVNYTIQVDRGLAQGSLLDPVTLIVDQIHNGQVEPFGVKSYYKFNAQSGNHSIELEETGGIQDAYKLVLLVYEQQIDMNSLSAAIALCNTHVTKTLVVCPLQNLIVGKDYYVTAETLITGNPIDYSIIVKSVPVI